MAIRAPARAPRAKAAGRPDLKVVKGRKRRWSPIPVVVLVVLAVFGVSVLQATMSQDGIKAARLEREVHAELERTTLLRARVSQLSNPRRVAEEAAKLGLVGAPPAPHVNVETEDPARFERGSP